MLNREQISSKFVDTVIKLERNGTITSRRELAEKLGWAEQLLSNAMNGYRSVPMDKVHKLIKSYRLDNFFDNLQVSQGALKNDTNISESTHQQDIDTTIRLSQIKIKLSEII